MLHLAGKSTSTNEHKISPCARSSFSYLLPGRNRIDGTKRCRMKSSQGTRIEHVVDLLAFMNE